MRRLVYVRITPRMIDLLLDTLFSLVLPFDELYSM